MNINTNYTQPSFCANFINNKSFRDVVFYAEKTKKLAELECALNRLSHANRGEILLEHGQSEQGIFSKFSINGCSVQNFCDVTKLPEEISFKAIVELAHLGEKFKKLFGNNIRENYDTDEIIKKYSNFYI